MDCRDAHAVQLLNPQIRWTKSTLAAWGAGSPGGVGGPAPGAEVSSFVSKQWAWPDPCPPPPCSTQAASTSDRVPGLSGLDARELGVGGLETRRGQKRRDGRVEERQETREQRIAVRGEGDEEGREGHTGLGGQKERKGPCKGATVEEKGWTSRGSEKTRKPEWSFQIGAKVRKLKRQGKEALPGKQENRGRGSLMELKLSFTLPFPDYSCQE